MFDCFVAEGDIEFSFSQFIIELIYTTSVFSEQISEWAEMEKTVKNYVNKGNL